MFDRDWDQHCKEAKTEKEKIHLMVEFITESHLDYFGGYPYDGRWIGDIFVVAELDDGKDRYRTQITAYKRKELLQWFDRACACYKKWGDDSIEFIDAVHEEAP